MMDLYKRENLSPFSGCLTSIVQIILLFAMFGLVRSPLTYMKKIDNNVLGEVQRYIQTQENIGISQSYPQIGIVKYVSGNKDKTIEISREENKEEKDQINLNDLYINMNFFGLDLSNIPQEKWNNPTVFIIPVLYVLTSIISMKITTKMTSTNNKNKDLIEIKKEENKEKEPDAQEMTEQMNKSMSWFMPIMAVSISLIAPLGLALYWLVSNIAMIAERIVLDKVIKTEEE